MKNKKCLFFAILLILFGIIITPIISADTANVTSGKSEHLSNLYENTRTNDFIVDAFVIGKFKDIRYGELGTIYIDAALVYTTQFHRFYTGELEITGFRGILRSSFICGFYNDGW